MPGAEAIPASWASRLGCSLSKVHGLGLAAGRGTAGGFACFPGEAEDCVCVYGCVDEGGARLCSYLMHVGAEEYFT